MSAEKSGANRRDQRISKHRDPISNGDVLTRGRFVEGRRQGHRGHDALRQRRGACAAHGRTACRTEGAAVETARPRPPIPTRARRTPTAPRRSKVARFILARQLRGSGAEPRSDPGNQLDATDDALSLQRAKGRFPLGKSAPGGRINIYYQLRRRRRNPLRGGQAAIRPMLSSFNSTCWASKSTSMPSVSTTSSALVGAS